MKISRETPDVTVNRVLGKMEGNFIGAVQEAEDLIKRFPHHPGVNTLMGLLHLRNGNTDQAERFFWRAFPETSGNSALHQNLAICAKYKGRLGEALAYIKSAVALQEDPIPPLLEMLGVLHYQLGDLAEAEGIFTDLVAKRTNNELALFYQWRLACARGDYNKAAETRKRLLSEFSKDHKALWRWIEFFQLMGHSSWTRINDKGRIRRHIDSYRFRCGPETLRNFPQTYVMPDDLPALEAAHAENPRLWMVKPTTLFWGFGLKLIQYLSNIPRRPGWVVQEYIDNPYLFHGHKTSLRVFLVITSVTPLRVYLYRGGSAVMALRAYRTGSDAIDDMAMHVAHHAVFKDQEGLKESAEEKFGAAGTIWPYSQIARYIEAHGGNEPELWENIEKIAKDAVRLIEHAGIISEIASYRNPEAFLPKIVALDLVIDEDLRVWPTEIETGPTTGRLFDGGYETNPVFNDLADIVFSEIDGVAASQSGRTKFLLLDPSCP